MVTCAPAADCTARRRSRRLERPRSPRARLLRAREGDWEACGGDPCTRRPDVTVWSRWKVTTSRGARRLLCRPRVCQTAGVCVESACLHLTPRCVLSRWRMYLFLIIVSGSVVRLLSSLKHSPVSQSWRRALGSSSPTARTTRTAARAWARSAHRLRQAVALRRLVRAPRGAWEAALCSLRFQGFVPGQFVGTTITLYDFEAGRS